MDLGESIRSHASRQATTGDWLIVDHAVFMSTPAQKAIETRSLPLLTYSVFGNKFVSLRSENNSPRALLCMEQSHRSVCLTAVRHYRLWTRQWNWRVTLKRAGATSRTFWAAESRKS